MTTEYDYVPVSLRVTVDLSGFTGVAPANGAVDPTKTYAYEDVSTYDLSQAKVRGNVRWDVVVHNLNFENTTKAIFDIVSDGTIDTAPTEIEFTVSYPNFNDLYTYDETNNNASIIRGLDAIKRMVARSLMTEVNDVRTVYDPTSESNAGGEPFEIGFRVIKLQTGKLTSDLSTAEAAVTVTQL